MVSNINDFKNASRKELTLSGGLTIMVQKPSLLAIARKGKIPNALMAEVSAMFGETAKNQKVTENLVNDNFGDLVELVEAMCEAAVVEPKYADIKDYLSDEQKFEIFSFTQADVNEVAPSLSAKGNNIDNSDGSTVQG